MLDRPFHAASASLTSGRRSRRVLVALLVGALVGAARAQVEDLATVHQRLKVLTARGKFREAERQAHEAMPGRPSGDRLYLAIYMARLQMQQGHSLEAWSTLDDAEALLADLPPGEATQRVQFYDARGQLALELGQVDVAAASFAQRSRLQDDPLARWYETVVAIVADDFADAEVGARAAMQAPPKNVDRGDIELLHGMAHWRQEPADPLRAEFARAAIRRALEATQQDIVRCSANVRLAELELTQNNIEAAAAAIAAAATFASKAELKPDLAADLTIQRARIDLARGVEPTALAAHRAALRSAADRVLERWRGLPPRPGGYGLLQASSPRSLFTTLIAVERRLHPGDPTAGLELLLGIDERNTLARRLGAARADLAGIRSCLLPAGGAIVYVLPALLDSIAVVITAADVAIFDLGNLVSLGRCAATLRRQLSDVDPAAPRQHLEAMRTEGRAAAATLGPELLSQLHAATEIVIIDDSLLDDLPFELLPGPDGGWLGAERPISYLPSLALGVALARRQATAGPDLRGFALYAATTPTADPDHSLAPLELGRDAGCWWSDLDGAATVIGPAASATGYATLPRASAFACILGHRVVAPLRRGDDRAAALAVAGEPAHLRCADVEAAGRQAACTLLGVCGGARNAQRRGDASCGDLAGSLLFGGAASVIAAEPDLLLGPVERAARGLLEAFTARRTPAQAMQLLRRQAVAAGSDDLQQLLSLRVIGLGNATVDAVGLTATSSVPGVAFPSLGLVVVGATLLWQRRRGNARRARRRGPA